MGWGWAGLSTCYRDHCVFLALDNCHAIVLTVLTIQCTLSHPALGGIWACFEQTPMDQKASSQLAQWGEPKQCALYIEEKLWFSCLQVPLRVQDNYSPSDSGQFRGYNSPNTLENPFFIELVQIAKPLTLISPTYLHLPSACGHVYMATLLGKISNQPTILREIPFDNHRLVLDFSVMFVFEIWLKSYNNICFTVTCEQMR